MQIILLFLLITQTLYAIQINQRENDFVNLVKRDVHSSSVQDLNRHIKTYETGAKIIFDTPNFTLIDSLLSVVSTNRSQSSVRTHTTWLTRQISSDKSREIARYDSVKRQFILNSYGNFSYDIDANTGYLTLLTTRDENFLNTEIIMHAQSGISENDDILYDIYRFVRLSTPSLNCTTNITINLNQSTEITCTIDYDFFPYDDLENYQPFINLTIYSQDNDSLLTPVDPEVQDDIKDNNNRTSHWTRLIRYTIRSISPKENIRDYVCIIVPDTLRNEDILQDEKRICRTRIHVNSNHSSTVIFIRLSQWNIIDILIIVLITLSSLLCLSSLILCLISQHHNRKRIVQIKPQNLEKTVTLPLGSKRTLSKENFFSNNNEIQSDIRFHSSSQFSEPSMQTLPSYRHKPGCPKYVPSPEYNLLSNDLFTHTTIDNMKKIILPDIPETNDLVNDQTYIQFYIPSKNENLSMKKLHL